MKLFINLFVYNKKALLFVLLLGCFDLCNAMFDAGDICKAIQGPLKGQEVIIEGTCQQIFGIKDVEELVQKENLWRNPALKDYLCLCLGAQTPEVLDSFRGVGFGNYADQVADNIKKELSGMFYYGKIREYDAFGICIHPSWLEKIGHIDRAPKAMADEITITPVATRDEILDELFETLKKSFEAAALRSSLHLLSVEALKASKMDQYLSISRKAQDLIGIRFELLLNRQVLMRELGDSLTEEQFFNISDRARVAAQREIETPGFMSPWL